LLTKKSKPCFHQTDPSSETLTAGWTSLSLSGKKEADFMGIITQFNTKRHFIIEGKPQSLALSLTG
jgi:hypothetical protein